MAIPAPAEHPPGAIGRHGFHSLRVLRTVRETADASSFVLEVPPDLRDTFDYQAGQFCTFRVLIEGKPVYRCYSMSSSPEVGDPLQVTVKRVPDGTVSNWMNDALAAGDAVDVSPPTGTFLLPVGEGDVVAFGGGSGITPMLSILKTGLATTSRRFRLLYANRDPDAVIFGAAIDELALRYPEHLTVVHHHDVDRGFVGPDSVRPLVGNVGDTEYLICGPTPFMDIVEQTLLDEGVAEGRIHIERFTPSESVLEAEPLPEEPPISNVTIELDGRVDNVEHRPGTTILQVARQLGMSPPFSCESGNCATCMAKLVEGTVTMRVNDVLDDDEVADGWVLTCQAVPTAPSVRVVYGYEED